MKSNKIINNLLSCLFLLTAFISNGQQVVTHAVPFSSGMQNMWGPSFNAFTINQTINLFNVSWNESFGTGNAGIVNILGSNFGAAVNGHFSGTIGSNFYIQGFSNGEVQVDYPIEVELDMPTDYTYDQGDVVTIQSSYTVDSGYVLDTYYPNDGEIGLDVYFQLGASLSAELCAFSCFTFPVIPNFNTGLQTINVFKADNTGIGFLGVNGGSMLFNYASPISTSMIPGDPLGGYGLEASLSIPYVTTSDGISGYDLSACGEDSYVDMTLEIFQLMSNLPYPPPLTPLGPILENLSGSETIPLGVGNYEAEISWNFLSALFRAENFNKQCFDFKPKVYGKFEFPVAVEYDVLDSLGTSVLTSGVSSIINTEIGNRIRYKFPCYFADIDIVSTYSIDGQFTNHTYDSIAFSFEMSAFAFALTFPSIQVTPAVYVPQVCITFYYPCPTWSNPAKLCSKTVCTPAYTIPAVNSGALNFNVGPLFQHIIPIGSVKYDWFNQTWALEGFSEYTMPSFRMSASPLGITNSLVDVSCYGGNDGAIDITTSAVSPALPYTYTWTNGASTEDLTGLSAGPYNVSVIDANNCQLFTGATIQEPQQPLSISIIKTDKKCNGGVDDGAIDALIQGGTAPYTYAWSNGATTEDISGLAVGTYTLTVTDSKLCSENVTVTIDQPNVLGQVGAITNVNCKNDADGVIQVDVFGGVLPYSYTWTGPSGYTNSIEDINGLVGGTYSLTIIDGNGCLNTQLYNVTEPATLISLSSTKVDVNCKYDSTGAIDITVNGGTPGYFFKWSNGQGVVLPFQTEDLMNIPADSYTVIVTDANGCTEQLTEVVNEPLNEISSTEILTDINCFGDATGSVDPGISGGTSPYTYVWSNGAISAVNNAIPAGTYDLLLTDFNGCTENYSYTLTEPNAPLVVTLNGTDVNCFGEASGGITSSVSGGTPSYTYLWNNGATTPNVANIIAGTYDLTVFDDKGCVAIQNVTINQPLAPLSITSTFVDVDCYGNSSGAIDATVMGGTMPYNYQWSNGGSVIQSDTTEDLSNILADTYTLLVTDNKGCVESLATTVSQPLAPISITGIVDDVNCFGMNDGGIDITTQGGTSGYTFLWSNGATTEDITNIVSGTYSVTVTDLNGCTESTSFDVGQPLAPIAIITNPKDVNCTGGNDGWITSQVSGGTAPYVYSWSNGETTNDIYNLNAGNYTLTITDNQGCVAFSGAVVGEPAQALVVNTTITDVSCFGGNDGEVVLTISGGVEPYYFNWGNQNEILLNNPSEILDSLYQGDYFIRVRDKNGCINEQTITVNEPPLFEATTVVTDLLCNGDSSGAIDLIYTGGTPNYSTVWSNGATTEDIINLAAGTYDYTGTDNLGCIVKGEVVVGEPDSVQLTEQLIPVSCIDQSDAAIYITPYGGTMPYSFVWSNGETSQDIEGLKPGMYDVTIIDDNGCTYVFNFDLIEVEDECLGIPNTFTPNGDNYNDTWMIRNIDLYPNATVKVFNRWGNELYSTEGEYIPWDGTHNGNPLPSEVYYYIIVLDNDQDNKYTGTITIIR